MKKKAQEIEKHRIEAAKGGPGECGRYFVGVLAVASGKLLQRRKQQSGG